MDQSIAGENTPAHEPSRRAVLRGIGLGGVAAVLIAAGWKVEATAQESTPSADVAAEPNAIVVLFGQPDDVAAFEEYYRTSHWPLALTMPRMQEITGGLILGTPEKTESEYHRMVILRYASQADLTMSIASPKGREVLADVENFATGGVTVLITSLESEPGRGAS